MTVFFLLSLKTLAIYLTIISTTVVSLSTAAISLNYKIGMKSLSTSSFPNDLGPIILKNYACSSYSNKLKLTFPEDASLPSLS